MQSNNLINKASVTRNEKLSAIKSFTFFFLLMSAYFMLRPVRDEMGIQSGVNSFQWLFTGTFVVTVLVVWFLSVLFRRFSRNKLLPAIYFFFAAIILLFYGLFSTAAWLAASFFIWLSVFNLLAISLFWSCNADFFSASQAKKLYGPIASGGSIGAIVGPVLTTLLVGSIGVRGLLLCAGVLLLAAAIFLHSLIKDNKNKSFKDSTPKGTRHILQQLGNNPMMRQVAGFLLIYTCVSTFLYYEQAEIVAASISNSEERTAFFSLRDLIVNGITLAVQFFMTGRFIEKLGSSAGLMLVPRIAIVGIVLLGFSQSLYVLLFVQVAYRSMNFSIQRPVRELVFTTASLENKYLTKNVIDTVIYRGGDAISSWLIAAANVIMPLKVIAFFTVPLALVWVRIGQNIGNLFDKPGKEQSKTINYAYTKESA